MAALPDQPVQNSTSICGININKCIYDVIDTSSVSPLVSLILYGKLIGWFMKGGFLVLFGSCICVLRQKQDAQRFHCVIIAALFIVATCGLGFNVAGFFTKATFHLIHGTTQVIVSGEKTAPTFSFPSTGPVPGDSRFLSAFNTGRRLQRATQICNIIANILTDGILVRAFSIPIGGKIWSSPEIACINPVMEMLPNLAEKTSNPTSPWAALLLEKRTTVIGIVNVALLPKGTRPIRETFSPVSTGENFFSISFEDSNSGEKLTTDSILLVTFAIGSAAFNVLLTLLIEPLIDLLVTATKAGRIFWISRKVARFTNASNRNMYRVIISATLESGLLYPIVLVLYVTFMLLNTTPGRKVTGMEPGAIHVWRVNLGAEVLYSMLIPIMGISSTLIIVRASLGLAIQDEETCRETMMSEFCVAVVSSTNRRSVLDPLPNGSRVTSYIESTEVISVDLESHREKYK
ncbi:hypothetical protein L218DRAFT_1029296 [Marasmius fiardii PR-910]|nr:hypothetical protein L218DRAFT_1029296 [Marasmius fiardii PR-910]